MVCMCVNYTYSNLPRLSLGRSAKSFSAAGPLHGDIVLVPAAFVPQTHGYRMPALTCYHPGSVGAILSLNMIVHLWLLLGTLLAQDTRSQEQIILANQTHRVLHAVSAVNSLQTWYNDETGLWDTTGWWNSANVLTMLADFVAVNPSIDQMANIVFQNTFIKAQETNMDAVKVMTPSMVDSYTWPFIPPAYGRPLPLTSDGFLNNYYDDEGWWALGWLKVYDHVDETRYLQAAIDIFEDMTTGWGAPCGGLWWSKDHTYTGAIENELFLTVAAQLANRVVKSRKNYYLEWALKEWDWFKRSGMINSNNNINNGIDFATCQNDNGTVWTYNQGVVLGGLLELHKASPDRSYLITAEKIAVAAIETLSDSNDILHEPCEPDCGADGPQFKGIFMRNLQLLQKMFPNQRFKKFIEKNADSIWLNDRGGQDQLDLVWSGPFSSATASKQSSACDALVAAMAEDV